MLLYGRRTLDGYPGPVRDEPLAIELHNTLYAADGERHDGLATQASADAWLSALDERLPRGSTGRVRAERLRWLRTAVRDVLGALAADRRPSRPALEAINATSTAAPCAVVARADAATVVRAVHWGEATREEVVLAALARDAIELVTEPSRTAIRACGAPGCVLLYLRSHPRQAWCSSACGNRARQARHYRRTREQRSRSTRT